MNNDTIIKGKFYSNWDDNVVFETDATLNEDTGEIETISVEADNVENLNYEKFVSEDEQEYDICFCCHRYIVKTIVIDTDGTNLEEAEICMDPSCSNHSDGFDY